MTDIASRGATMGVDWEQRIDFARLRADRLARARAEELLVAGHRYVRGADVLDGRVEVGG